MEQVILNDVRDQSYTMRESLRALRVNIEFCGDDKKVIMFTSTAPDEGKSTVTFELARTIAAAGKTVLYIDTDMRKSAMVGRHRAKTVSGKEILGLSHFLSGWKKVEKCQILQRSLSAKTSRILWRQVVRTLTMSLWTAHQLELQSMQQ